MEIFSPDSPIYRFMRNLTDLLVINVLWALCSLPVITLGPATIAAFDVTMKMAGDEDGHVGKQFWEAFRKNLKTGIPYGLLLLAGCYMVWLDFSLFEQLEEHPFLLLVCGWVGGFALLMMFLYAFALQARYRNSVLRTLKNSADIAIRYFLRTILLIALLVLEVFLIFWNSTTLFFGILIGPAAMIYTISGFARYFFREIEKEPGAVSPS